MSSTTASFQHLKTQQTSGKLQPSEYDELVKKNSIHVLSNSMVNLGLDLPGTEHLQALSTEDENEYDLGDLKGATEAWWTTGAHAIPAHLIEDVDENVKALLPKDSVIISIDPHRDSTWSRTAEIQTELEGEEISYFIKVTDFSSGEVMYRSEFESLVAIDQAIPGFCPKPIGWGNYASDSNVHFLLSSFIDMIDEPPDQVLLPQRLAELHQKAIAPDLKYGWHVPMAGGLLPISLAKSNSWEFFFTQYMRFLFKAEELAQGPRPEVMERLVSALFKRVIPRLIRPLETGGREIVPRLLHTDLWHGNVSVDEQGLPIIFDPCSMYGHNESDLGVWLNPRVNTGRPFINSYHNFFAHSAPEEDHIGRNLLYSLAFEARVSAVLVGNKLFRDEVIRYMAELDHSHPETYGEWAHARGERACQPKWKLEKS